MAVGQGSLEAYNSYLAVGRESTFGTYNTCTSGLDFISASMKTTQESKMIEQIETGNRTYSKNFRAGKVIEGEIEGYVYAESTAFNYLLAQAFGGSVTSAAATGESSGGAAYDHTYPIGIITDQSYPSISLNMRKGNSAGAKVFQYHGVRVNEANFSAEIDEALKCSFSVIGKDSTLTTNDVASAIGVDTLSPLSFIGGRISIEAGTLGQVTTTSFWHVQNVEIGISNNLKSDSGSRRIGSDTLDVLPPGIAALTFNATIRFDTSTAYAAMLANTSFAAEIQFQGDTTMPSSVLKPGIKFQFPVLKIADAGDPEIGGPDEMLTSQVTFHVLRDTSSAGGYAMRAIVTNDTSSY